MKECLQQPNSLTPALNSGRLFPKKITYFFIAFLPFLSFSLEILAQNHLITGTVTDQDGKALIGASVTIKNTQVGTSTDANGTFSLNAPNANSTLVITFIGFTTQEVPVNNMSTINLSMVPDGTTLKDVVVVGYGVQKKKALPGQLFLLTKSNCGPCLSEIRFRGSRGEQPVLLLRIIMLRVQALRFVCGVMAP